MAQIGAFLPARCRRGPRGSPLPGGDFPPDGFDALVARRSRRWPFLAEPHARRLVRAYGTPRRAHPRRRRKAWTISAPCFAGDLTGAEVRYLIEHEWAQTADDVLWRRSKLGLTATPEERDGARPVHRVVAGRATALAPSALWFTEPYCWRRNCVEPFY